MANFVVRKTAIEEAVRREVRRQRITDTLVRRGPDEHTRIFILFIEAIE